MTTKHYLIIAERQLMVNNVAVTIGLVDQLVVHHNTHTYIFHQCGEHAPNLHVHVQLARPSTRRASASRFSTSRRRFFAPRRRRHLSQCCCSLSISPAVCQSMHYETVWGSNPAACGRCALMPNLHNKSPMREHSNFLSCSALPW